MQKRILIVGGGTSGWMTANILAYAFQHHPFHITVVESPDIPIIGVGEGSTPALKVFFDGLGISEREWMPQCNATYKCGITFKDWSRKPGYQSYFHPFASSIDLQGLAAFKHNVQACLHGVDVDVTPDHFFLSARLAAENLAPIANYNFPFELNYGYHFDAQNLGKFLREKAIARGVNHLIGTVEQVRQKSNGEIDYLVTKEQQTLVADFFVDCSGFRSILSQKALNTPYTSYKNALFNDAAVALPTAMGEVIPSQTLSTALRFGWAWQIPLRDRFGNGYVYSSTYCGADEAETELRRHLNLLDSDVEARHIKMKVGRVDKSWHKNVLAVGLAQGFIEPLEATALLLNQQTVSLFAHYFIQGKFTDQYAEPFNLAINEQFDRTKDYIYTHYQTNSRDDTAYWRDNSDNKSVMTESVSRIYRCWVSGENLEQEILQQEIERFYPVSSWYCILAGMGILPSRHQLKPAPADKDAYLKDNVSEFITRCAANFRDHRALLACGDKLAPLPQGHTQLLADFG